MRIDLAYGSSKLPVTVPDDRVIGVLKAREVRAEGEGCLARAVSEPSGARIPGDLAGKKVAIVVDDHTRSAPTGKMLPPILRRLGRAGCRDSNITIIFACGTHRGVREEEAEAILGKVVCGRVDHMSHNCRAADQVEVGATPTLGNRVLVDRAYSEADFRILTGDVELHYYAGYSGGRKSILPGICAEETIMRNHHMMMHPQARIGNLEGNPVHIDMTEAARIAGSDFTLNAVKNGGGEIVGAFAGDVEGVFSRGVDLVGRIYKVPISRRADIVVTGAGGYDIDFYQAYKPIHIALNAVRDGGTVIVAAECREGCGNELFYDWISRYGSMEEAEGALREGFRLGAHKAYYLLKALSKARIVVATAMERRLTERLRVEWAPDIQTAVDEELRAKRDAVVYIIPSGGRVLPIEAG